MKKLRKICLLLVLVLLLQSMILPGFATEDANDGSQDPSDSASDVTGGEDDLLVDPTGSTGTEEEFPSNVTGDASINSGCNTINAQSPLVSNAELVVDGSAALMYEITSDTLLYGYNPDAKMYPASLTKIMTCLVALDRGNINDLVTVSETALEGQDPSGSSCDLIVGEEMKLKDMLYCLMVSSANDAASVIAEHIGGNEERFVEMMNEKAAELGCTNTHFANPHGLHDDDHYTCARDMAKIMLAALEYDLFNDIYSTTYYEVPETNMSGVRDIYTTNYMIGTNIIEQYYDSRVVGGKTGFTTPAGRCLVVVAESRGLKVLTVFMGGKTSQDETGMMAYGSFEETTEMLNYCFDNIITGQILSPNDVLTSFPVAGAANNTQAYAGDVAWTALPSSFTYEQLRYEYILDDGTLSAPVYADESLGIVRVWYQSRCLAQREIFATVTAEVQTSESTRVTLRDTEKKDSGFLQVILTIILILLGLILLLVLITMARNAFIRARRRKRRRSRVRSR